MIDRRKLATAGAVVLAIIAVFAVGVVWVVAHNGSAASAPTRSTAAAATKKSRPSPSSSATTQAPMPTNGGGGSPEPSGQYTNVEAAQRFGKIATKAAIAAATWDGANTHEVLRKQYLAGGFSPKLAAHFKPLWAQVFNSPKVFHYKDTRGRTDLTATITAANQGAEPGLNSTHGKVGHRQFRFGVAIKYTANWSQKSGSDSYQQDGLNTWWVTVDEATGKAVAVQQPTQADIGFRIK